MSPMAVFKKDPFLYAKKASRLPLLQYFGSQQDIIRPPLRVFCSERGKSLPYCAMVAFRNQRAFGSRSFNCMPFVFYLFFSHSILTVSRTEKTKLPSYIFVAHHPLTFFLFAKLKNFKEQYSLNLVLVLFKFPICTRTSVNSSLFSVSVQYFLSNLVFFTQTITQSLF